MAKKNSKLIRADTEIFLPELERFGQKNEIPDKMPNITREVGKVMREMRLNGTSIKSTDIKF